MTGTARIGARAAVVAARAALLLALWVLLVDKTERWEVITGAVCAVIAALVTEAVQAASGLRFAIRPRWVLRTLPAPWWIARDSVRVLWAIVTRRPAVGRLRAVPFPAAGHTPRDRGRRALAFGAGSAGPNQYAMTESGDDDVLVVHELVPTDGVTAVDVVRDP